MDKWRLRIARWLIGLSIRVDTQAEEDDNLYAIIDQAQESRVYLDFISELLTKMNEPDEVMIEMGDHLASLQTLFQRIEAYAREERLSGVISG